MQSLNLVLDEVSLKVAMLWGLPEEDLTAVYKESIGQIKVPSPCYYCPRRFQLLLEPLRAAVLSALLSLVR